LEAHKAGEFQFLCSVNMLTKGYDDAGLANVFMCRPTQSKRLYTQVLGRGTRLGDPTIGGLPTPGERKDAIAASSKPCMTMFNLVGICPTVKDLNIVDVLYPDIELSARALASKMLMDSFYEPDQPKPDDEDGHGQPPPLPDYDAIEIIAEAVAKDAAIRERLDAERREKARVDAEVMVRFSEPFRAISAPDFMERDRSSPAVHSEKTLAWLRKCRVPDGVILRLSEPEAKRLSQDLIVRHKRGLSTWPQMQLLKRHGVDASRMTRDEASRHIDAVLNGRPIAVPRAPEERETPPSTSPASDSRQSEMVGTGYQQTTLW
jgi:hypothetical protein